MVETCDLVESDTAGRVLEETDQNGNVLNDYFYLGDERMGRVNGQGALYFYYNDQLSTTRIMTDRNGNVCYDADYFPWGDEQHVYLNTCGQNYKFTGKERDPDMDIDDFGARFYKAGMGRFYSPDWSATVEPVPYAKLENPQSLNLYAYVTDNPLRFSDPDGHVEGAPDGNGEEPPGSPGGAGSPQTGAQNHNPPPPDANHTHTLTVREVSGQQGNPANHITVQVDNGKEVGFGPVQDMTAKQIIENTPVPGQVEPRAAGVTTVDAVTVYMTKDEAAQAQGTIDARTTNPGDYQRSGRSCVDFGEDVVRSTGARAPSDTLPSHLIRDLRAIQIQDNTTQAP